jgi:hypothetical protein
VIEINHQLLVELGLGHLDQRRQEVVQRRIYEVLEGRVGLTLVNSLTKSEQEIFNRAFEESPEKAHSYLARVVPNYAAVVRNEMEFIVASIAQGVRQGAAAIGGPKTDRTDNA